MGETATLEDHPHRVHAGYVAPRAAPVGEAVDAAATTPRWVGAAVLWALLVTASLNAVLPDLMATTGRRGTEFVVLALVPLFAAAARAGAAGWTRPLLRPSALVTAMLALSLLVGEHTNDGAVKVFITLSGVAWGVVLLDDRPSLDRVARHGALLCLVLGAVNLAGVEQVPRPSHLLALAVLYARLLRDEDRDAPPTPAGVLIDLGLLGMIFLSTFRAAAVAAVMALAAAARRSRSARLVLVFAALGALPLFLSDEPLEPTYSAAVARDDWRGRYSGIAEDRLSGRTDIWANVWADITG
jgi:hypothetical protein